MHPSFVRAVASRPAFAAVLIASLAAPRHVPGQAAIVDVTVIDVATGARRSGQTVVLAGDSIVAVGASRDVRLPRGGRAIDGRGKFLIPGLWDMHVHLGMTGRTALPLFLGTGVTGVRDMGGDPVVLRWRDSVAAGTMTGPRIKGAGLIVENDRWLKAVIGMMRAQQKTSMLPELERRLGIVTPAHAERAIDSLVRLGADFVKIRNYPAPATYVALAAAARRRGLTLAGHAPPFAQVGDVSDSGLRSLEHPVLDLSNGGLVEAFSRLDAPARRALFERLARNGTAWTPTFVAGHARLGPDSMRLRSVNDSLGLIDEAFRVLPSVMRAEWRRELADGMRDPDTRTDWGTIQRASLALAREMLDAGVRLLAGTDTPVIPLVPGYSLHDELALMVRDGGLTPLEALQSATVSAAAALGLERKSGRIVPGGWSDLVLLDADPLLDIRATRRVRAVVSRGVVYDRSALDALLQMAR